MLIAVTYNKKKVQGFEFFFGICLSLGMIFFAAADFTVSPNFDFIGKSIDPLDLQHTLKDVSYFLQLISSRYRLGMRQCGC
jgi:hypothetical protein